MLEVPSYRVQYFLLDVRRVITAFEDRGVSPENGLLYLTKRE